MLFSDFILAHHTSGVKLCIKYFQPLNCYNYEESTHQAILFTPKSFKENIKKQLILPLKIGEYTD